MWFKNEFKKKKEERKKNVLLNHNSLERKEMLKGIVSYIFWIISD